MVQGLHEAQSTIGRALDGRRDGEGGDRALHAAEGGAELVTQAIVRKVPEGSRQRELGEGGRHRLEDGKECLLVARRATELASHAGGEVEGGEAGEAAEEAAVSGEPRQGARRRDALGEVELDQRLCCAEG